MKEKTTLDRQGFTLMREHFNACVRLGNPEDEGFKLLKAVGDYALDGVEPVGLPLHLDVIFDVMKYSLTKGILNSASAKAQVLFSADAKVYNERKSEVESAKKIPERKSSVESAPKEKEKEKEKEKGNEKEKDNKKNNTTLVREVSQKKEPKVSGTSVDEPTPRLTHEVLVSEVIFEQSISKVAAQNIPYQQIVAYYEAKCKGMPRVSKLSETRRKLVKARWMEHGRESIGDMLRKAGESRFLQGDNSRGWVADFSWLFNAANFIKIIEGNYSNKAKPKVPLTFKEQSALKQYQQLVKTKGEAAANEYYNLMKLEIPDMNRELNENIIDITVNE